jgi:hypothetical protein
MFIIQAIKFDMYKMRRLKQALDTIPRTSYNVVLASFFAPVNYPE